MKPPLLGAIMLLVLSSTAHVYAQTLTSITLTPSNPTITAGETLRFVAAGSFSDGSTRDILAAPTHIGAGRAHTCVVLSDGEVKCWGSHVYGQLGIGPDTSIVCILPNNSTSPCSLKPVLVNGISTATGISLGGHHTCALMVDGTVQCWGRNENGELGIGTGTGPETCTDTSAACSTNPVPVGGISNATALAAGLNHTCALLSDETVQCWGANSHGQLGNGTQMSSPTPVPVNGINTATAIVTGNHHTCALLSNGRVECWGWNPYGQLGNGTQTASSTPVPTPVSGISTATAVAAGSDHTCAILASRTVQCWGLNIDGQVGPVTGSTLVPVPVSGINTATAIAAGLSHTCAALSDGTLRCWGSNSKLGNGTAGSGSSPPVPVNEISTATAITSGLSHTCAVLFDSRVKCWGMNTYGQLGIGGSGIQIRICDTEPCSLTPVPVTGFSTPVAIVTGAGISVGFSHACAVLSTGSVKCWGSGATGHLGNGNLSDSSTPVPVSGISNATTIAGHSDHNCAVLSAGSVKCWGNGPAGQLGNGTMASSFTPVLVDGISTATGITVGGQHSCALMADSTLQCWGMNHNGELGIGSSTGPDTCGVGAGNSCSTTPVPVNEINTASAIAAGRAHTCAVLFDGSVACWGYNYNGALDIGSNSPSVCDGAPCSTTPVPVSGISTAITIAAGGDHTCAILADGTVQCWGRNDHGQLGNGTSTGPETCSSLVPCSTTPVLVSGTSDATAIAAGGSHTCAILADGTVQCWGRNDHGQLGNGTQVSSSTPVPVSGISDATDIAAGTWLTCALLADGRLQCWGRNDSGELGIDTSTGPETCVLANGAARSCSTIPELVSGMNTPLTVLWSSSVPAVATIDGEGYALGLSVGSTTITATSGSISGMTTLSVSLAWFFLLPLLLLLLILV